MISSIMLFAQDMLLPSIIWNKCLYRCCLYINDFSQVFGFGLRAFFLFFKEWFLYFSSNFRWRICCFSDKIDCEFALKIFLTVVWYFLWLFERFDHLNQIILQVLIFDPDIEDLLEILSISCGVVLGLDLFLFLLYFNLKIMTVDDPIFQVLLLDLILL